MKISVSVLLLAALANSSNTLADEAKLEGQWRGNGGAALSISAGNTNSKSLNLTADAARLTPDDKLSIYGQIMGSRSESNGVTSTTSNQWMAGTRQDHNISVIIFGFCGLHFSHDQIKFLALRSVISGGLGYHVIRMIRLPMGYLRLSRLQVRQVQQPRRNDQQRVENQLQYNRTTVW